MPRTSSKEKYIENVYELFRNRGLALTMDEIASELGLTKKTLYNNFNSKEELMLTVAHRVFNEIEERINISLKTGKNAIEMLYNTSKMLNDTLLYIGPLLLNDAAKYLPDLKVLDHTNRMSFNSRMISENLKRGISEGLYRNDMNKDMITLFFASAIAKMYQWDGAYVYLKDPYLFHSELISYHLNSIVSDKGRKILKKYR